MWPTASCAASYREATEDCFHVLSRMGAGSVLLVVADGVGGRPGGGEAARKAVALVVENEGAVRAGDARGWAGLLTHVDSELSRDTDAGETTLVVVEVTAARVVGASVGDSEAWLVAKGEETVKLTASQVRKPFAGIGMARPVSFDVALPPGVATLVVATDGLYGYADAEDVCDAALSADLDEAARRLVEAARSGPSRRLYDDVAVALCRTTLAETVRPVWRRWLSGS